MDNVKDSTHRLMNANSLTSTAMKSKEKKSNKAEVFIISVLIIFAALCAAKYLYLKYSNNSNWVEPVNIYVDMIETAQYSTNGNEQRNPFELDSNVHTEIKEYRFLTSALSQLLAWPVIVSLSIVAALWFRLFSPKCRHKSQSRMPAFIVTCLVLGVGQIAAEYYLSYRLIENNEKLPKTIDKPFTASMQYANASGAGVYLASKLNCSMHYDRNAKSKEIVKGSCRETVSKTPMPTSFFRISNILTVVFVLALYNCPKLIKLWDWLQKTYPSDNGDDENKEQRW